tara:strand:- start:4194 stop:4781 length:588 start_codon:yes stop_codon:yes gene_type:complete
VDLLILRHGQSEWNAQGKWQGQADPPLTDLGVQQALRAAEHLRDANFQFDLIASSDLQRAKHTAEIISQTIGGGPVLAQTEFRERHAGAWEGLTRVQIEASWPGAIEEQRWPEGYENDHSVMARLIPALERLRPDQKSVLIVGHAGLIRALDRRVKVPDAAITNHLSGRWYSLKDDLKAGDIADFSEQALLHELE